MFGFYKIGHCFAVADFVMLILINGWNKSDGKILNE